MKKILFLRKSEIVIFVISAVFFVISLSLSKAFAQSGPSKNWKLVFEENFDCHDAGLDANWNAQNGANSHILCSRWRENATLENGILKLNNKKETKANQAWTSASIWTKKKFLYGYFECRYKYADAAGVNNSFWLITTGKIEDNKKHFEIDINEGHYPNEINTNLHNWSDFFQGENGKKLHHSYHKSFKIGAPLSAPWNTFENKNGVKTSKIRIYRPAGQTYFHIREIRAYGDSADGYPDARNWDGENVSGLEDLVYGANINASGAYENGKRYLPQNACDRNSATSWVSNKLGEKWLEVDFQEAKKINCVQVLTGWYSGKNNNKIWNSWADSFNLQYWDDANAKWRDFPTTANTHYAKDAVNTKLLRVSASGKSKFSIAEIKVFNAGDKPLASAYADSEKTKCLQPIKSNLKDSSVSSDLSEIFDSDISTACKFANGESVTFTLSLDTDLPIDCIQIVFGGAKMRPDNYCVEFYDQSDKKWKTFAKKFPDSIDVSASLAAQYHTYGLEWNKDELIYYFDGVELRRMKNEICHSPAPVYLSAAIAEFAGEVSDKINGTSMDVDWVRVYELVPSESSKSESGKK